MPIHFVGLPADGAFNSSYRNAVKGLQVQCLLSLIERQYYFIPPFNTSIPVGPECITLPVIIINFDKSAIVQIANISDFYN